MSITGSITDGSLFGGMETTASAQVVQQKVLLTSVGSDSVLLSGEADSITLTGVLTGTSVVAGSGNDSLLVTANMSSASVAGAGDDTINSIRFCSIVATTIKGGAGSDKLKPLWGQ